MARSLLASQGIRNPNAISDSGEIDPMSLIALGFDKVEIRTAYSPPVTIDLNAPPDTEGDAQLRLVQPAIILTGRAGRAEIAPYGVPGGISARTAGISIALGLGAALVGTMLFGALIFRRR